MRHVLIVACAALSGLTACKRSVCEFGQHAPFTPMSEVWQSHKDLIPASATVCGHIPAGGHANEGRLSIDFASDDSPWVTLVDHLESKGYKRVLQSIDNPDVQSAKLYKGDESVELQTIREKGRVRASVSLGSHACETSRTSDGTACRENEIVQCDDSHYVKAVKQACGAGTKCVAAGKAPAVCQ